MASVSRETIEKAVRALLKWHKSKSKAGKPQLLEEDDFIYLILTLKRIPSKGRINPYKIPIKNPLYSPNSELCLIIDDRPKSGLTSADAKKKIKSEEVPVSKVLKLSKLKTDYRPFEAKRKLCQSFDVFFTDKRVIPLLPKLLGKQFFKKKRTPLPIDLTHKNWKEQIENACGSALLYLSTGTCSVIRVGKASQERDEIVENVVDTINGVAEIIPRKWANVRSFHLKFSESLALPIYQALPDMKLKIEGLRKDTEEVIKHEKQTGEEFGKKKVPKKGRIHEVRYMDSDVHGSMDDDEIDSDDGGDIGDGEISDNVVLGGDEYGGKKKRKGDLMETGKKQLKKLAKVKKGDADEKQKEEKKKIKVGKLINGETKVKDKKIMKKLAAQ